MYIFEGINNYASIIQAETYLNEAQKNDAISLEELPEILEEREGYNIVLKANKSENKVWYEYEKIIDEIVDLPTELEELTNYVLDVDFRVVMLEIGL